MRDWPAPVLTAIAAGTVVPRDFLWIVPRHRDTGAPVPYGFWSGSHDIDAQVVDPDGVTVERSWRGGAGLVEIAGIGRQSGLTVQTPTIVMSGIDPATEQVVRALNPRRARVEVYRAWLDPVTNALVAPAQGEFFGFVDTDPITTPAAGGEGRIELNCASYLQELTRSNFDRRSDASQRRRHATDPFFQHVAVVGDWQINWGRPDPPEGTE